MRMKNIGSSNTVSEEPVPKKRRFSWTTFIGILVCIIGIGILAYPTFANWWNSWHVSGLMRNYSEAVKKIETNDYEQIMADARAFNDSLREEQYPWIITDERHEEYLSVLNIGDGMMGYIEIPSVDIKLPIYHGTDEGVLQTAAGHMEGSSLPVGGKGTHCVLTGHRGLTSAKLFTDIDQLEIGDRFEIHIFDQILIYEVDNISVVLPNELSNLSIDPDQDYCTLVTCTPYGVNTHRLLVRGVRVN